MQKRKMSLAALVLALAAIPSAASTVIGLSIEDQARLAQSVVLGEVVGLEVEDHPDLGIETRVTLLVRETLKGSAGAGTTVAFHTREGALGSVESETPGEARFKLGQQVLVFIEVVEGRAYNLGLSMGVWNAHERDGAVTDYTRAVTDGLEIVGQEVVEHGPIAHRDMAARISWTAARPEFDHPMLGAATQRGR